MKYTNNNLEIKLSTNEMKERGEEKKINKN